MKYLWEKTKNLMTLWKQRNVKLTQRLWIKKGTALDKEGRLQKALTCYDTAQQIDPMDPVAWNFKGGVLLKLGKYTEARNAFRNFVKYAPPKYAKYATEAKAIIRDLDAIIKKEKKHG
jgi:tetratricopeptide (TPR) repeat protein